MRNKKLTIIGTGRLGLCFALTLEKNGYQVVGVDVNEDYINSLNNKTFNAPEMGVKDCLVESKYFSATNNIKLGLEYSDVLFLFVATPSLSSGRYDHTQIDKVVKQLADHAFPLRSKHLIIGSTTMPGYCDTIQERLQPHGYTVSYNPEFIAQGSVMRDLVNPDIILMGTENQSSGDEIEEIYVSILENKPTIHRMSRKEAEITKIALNCFLTTKIAFANMVGDIARSSGCNPDIILNAIGSDSRIGNRNLMYGFGFGGPCLPRDNRAFALFADDTHIDALISKATDEANHLHLDFQVKEFEKKYNKTESIVFSDLAYKSGTNIIEESQKLAIAVCLANKGFRIIIKDEKEIIEQIKIIYPSKFEYIEL